MRSGRRGWRTAALGAAAALVLLLTPLPLPPGGRMWQALGGGMHALLFAGLAWTAGRYLPDRLRAGVLLGALALFSAGVEWLQPHVGRSAELLDWLYGVGGAACICSTWHMRRTFGLRWVAVIALVLFPLGWELAMWRTEIRAFPVLAAPGSFWSGRGWTLNSVRISASSENHFRVITRPVMGAGHSAAYPGLFRVPAGSDWRRMESLQAAVFWPGPEPAGFAFRVDDRPGNPPYAERFQFEFAVTQGWNAVHIPAEELGRTFGGRAMRLDSICQWGVFLVSDVPFDYFSLGPVRLNLKQEHP